MAQNASMVAASGWRQLLDVVEAAQRRFAAMVGTLPVAEGLPHSVYVRFLSMQHALTKGVQKHFLAMAAHPELQGRTHLRRFLIDFGLEEEPHYALAKQDLDRLGAAVVPPPIDVALWWAYFDGVVPTRPFVRLGATCVLESISAQANPRIRELLANSPFLDASNTKFVVLHQHEVVPHGDQVLGEIERADLTEQQLATLVEGARAAELFYLRMTGWVLSGVEVGRGA